MLDTIITYVSNGTTAFLDINECWYNNGGCEGTCHNILRGYYCSCPVGQELGSDNHTCIGK